MTTTHTRPAADRPEGGPEREEPDGGAANVLTDGTRYGRARDTAAGPPGEPAPDPPYDPAHRRRPAHRPPHEKPPRPRGRTAPRNRCDTRRPGGKPARRPSGELRPHEWFAERLVLALSGQRPMHWLLGHTTGRAYDQLAAFADALPLRDGPRPELRACGYCRPAPDAIEAFARVAVGDRLRALAFRLELGPDHRWRCAAVEMDPSPQGERT
ncbi:Rv3235 family protein [Streptomyces sp. B8F3]|uniref:Rv3235 family protein n=1 Tax=Streptomyces sp. B8F3 TaxID=3153573 RepID=UPI00325F759B